MQRTPGVLAMLLSVASLGLLQPPDCKVLQQCLFSFCKLSSLESTRLSATSTPAHTFTAVLPSAAGFPEIEADTFLDWNSQASGEAPADHTLSAGDAPSDAESALYSNTQDCHQQQQCTGSLIWESAGLAPRLKLPVLVNPAHSSSNSGGVPSLPPDMPSGPSIATARVKHPLSSTESAALTQLRAELSALFAEANRGPDLSLVPLPRQLNQATAPTAGTDSAPVKVARPSRLQPRAAAAILRGNSRRRYTADAAVPNAMRTRHSLSAEVPQPMTELSHQGVTHPAVTIKQVIRQTRAEHQPELGLLLVLMHLQMQSLRVLRSRHPRARCMEEVTAGLRGTAPRA